MLEEEVGSAEKEGSAGRWRERGGGGAGRCARGRKGRKEGEWEKEAGGAKTLRNLRNDKSWVRRYLYGRPGVKTSRR